MRVLFASIVTLLLSVNLMAFDELVEQKLNSLSLQEKVGQLFIFGFHGHQLNSRLRRHLENTKPGGVIVFGHNIKNISQISKLNYGIQRLNSKLPLFIAVDQEGGTVSRVKINPPFPSALALGSTQDPALAERIGYLTGETLQALGFNMNLAPVMDIAKPTMKSFIGTRAFGGEPKSVAEMAVSYSRGLMMAGVLPTAKHFPGHGGTLSDSHRVLPKRNINLENLFSVDLVPFQQFSALPRMSAMMVAHISFPKIDQSRLPASFSKVLMKNILREQLHYKGLVVTDDFDMRAAQVGGQKYFDKVINSLNAGADIVMIAWSKKHQRSATRKLLQAIEVGSISESIIDEKVRRIIKAKQEYLEQQRVYTLGEIKTVLTSKFITDSFYEVLRTNLRRQRMTLRGFLNSSSAPQLVSGSHLFNKSFVQEFSSRVPVIPVSKNTQVNDVRKNLKKSRRTIFYVSGKRSARLANRLPKSIKQNTLIISVTRPFEIANPEEFAGVLNVYTPHPKLGKLIAKEIKKPKMQVSLIDSPLNPPPMTAAPEN